jgi:hypothetical protein
VQQGLTIRQVLALYIPLALSWLLMAMEGPTAVSVVSRAADSKVHLAAFMVLMAVSLFIESPVIDLLTTSTRLIQNRSQYRPVRSFAIGMMIWCTVIHALATVTPAYFVWTSWLHLDKQVVEVLRGPLIVMIPWSAAIGWRRWQQGLLIRAGTTRPVTVGTLMRLGVMLAAGFGLLNFSSLSGTMIAGIALVASVTTEALYVTWAARYCYDNLPLSPDEGSPLSWQDIAKFHLPLTMSTTVALATGTLLSGAISRAPDNVTQLAAWQVHTSVAWLFRTMTFALPEVIITCVKTEKDARLLRQFCIWLGVSLSVVQLLVHLTGLDRVIFATVLEVKPEVLEPARFALLLTAVIPLIAGALNYLRGRLALSQNTVARLVATVVSTIALVLSLAYFGQSGFDGVVIASGALVLSMVVDMGVQLYYWKKSRRAAAIGIE